LAEITKSMAEELIGKVVHYFNKIGVAVVKVEKGSLAVGDKIKFRHGEHEFEQAVESLQIEKEAVDSIKKGKEAGLKVNEAVKEGWEVYKIA